MAKAKSKGHVEHMKAKGERQGMPGRFHRPVKITMLGAGSCFTSVLTSDILQIPGAGPVEFALVDISRGRLSIAHKVVSKQLAAIGAPGWTVSATTDRREALPSSHYIINTIEVSGVECVRLDNDIPAKYGVDQCIGDTIGPGGLFKGLRTIPAWLDILRDAEELCPDALVLNYTNPMSMMCLAAGRASSMNVVGLCHSVQGACSLLARRARVPLSEMEWECAGINHLAWFTRLRHKGRDLYRRLMRMARQDLAGNPANPDDAGDLIRKDMMLHFGAYMTESSGHLSEYLPYYRKRKSLIRKYCGKHYDGESGFYARNWPTWRLASDDYRRKMLKGENPLIDPRSLEYASRIIESCEKDVPFRFHGNVMNNVNGAGQLITNLSADSCVEVACYADRSGVHPIRYGALPAQMAGLCESNIRMFDLAATAAVEKSKDAAIHALMLDPLTAAVCSPAEIREMTLALFKAERKHLKGYA